MTTPTPSTDTVQSATEKLIAELLAQARNRAWKFGVGSEKSTAEYRAATELTRAREREKELVKIINSIQVHKSSSRVTLSAGADGACTFLLTGYSEAIIEAWLEKRDRALAGGKP